MHRTCVAGGQTTPNRPPLETCCTRCLPTSSPPRLPSPSRPFASKRVARGAFPPSHLLVFPRLLAFSPETCCTWCFPAFPRLLASPRLPSPSRLPRPVRERPRTHAKRVRHLRLPHGTRHGPFNFTPMGVNSISPAHLHVPRAHMGRTWIGAGEIKKIPTRPENILPLIFNVVGRTAVTASHAGGHAPAATAAGTAWRRTLLFFMCGLCEFLDCVFNT